MKDAEHGLPSLAIVLGYIAIKNLTHLGDRARVLKQLGYGIPEIAQVCGETQKKVKDSLL